MKVRSHPFDGGTAYEIYCPGCKDTHHYWDTRWKFNGNFEKPTFTPSLRVFKLGTRETKCHINITDGVIKFHDDCPHELAKKLVPLPDLPE